MFALEQMQAVVKDDWNWSSHIIYIQTHNHAYCRYSFAQVAPILNSIAFAIYNAFHNTHHDKAALQNSGYGPLEQAKGKRRCEKTPESIERNLQRNWVWRKSERRSWPPLVDTTSWNYHGRSTGMKYESEIIRGIPKSALLIQNYKKKNTNMEGMECTMNKSQPSRSC